VTGSTGIETALGGLPVFTDGFLLQKYQGQVGVKGIIDHKTLAFRYTWCDKYRALFGNTQQAVVLPMIGLGLFRRSGSSRAKKTAGAGCAWSRISAAPYRLRFPLSSFAKSATEISLRRSYYR